MAQTDSRGHVAGLLLLYAEGGLDPETRECVWRHLGECPKCRMEYEEICQLHSVLTFVDKSAWGDKTPCPDSGELVQLSENPASMAEDRLDALKRHLAECFRCRESFQMLVDLNRKMRTPEFFKQYPMPDRLKTRLRRVVGDYLRGDAVSTEPVAITLEGARAAVAAEVCRELTGRAAPPDQARVPVLTHDITGVAATASGAPLRHEYISLIRNSAPFLRIRTSPQGAFYFTNLNQGFYEIRARGTRLLILLKKGAPV